MELLVDISSKERGVVSPWTLDVEDRRGVSILGSYLTVGNNQLVGSSESLMRCLESR